jgi:hypothetical protein
MNCALSKLKKENIEYYTPNWVWEDLQKFIPKNKVIWEAFRSENPLSTRSAEYLREMGFEVVNPLCDFFTNDYGDIVVSNPPFKDKRNVIERCFHLNKPFMLILPSHVLTTKYFCEWAKNRPELQFIIMRKRVDFIKVDSGKSVCSFHTICVCWKFNLENRITFL